MINLKITHVDEVEDDEHWIILTDEHDECELRIKVTEENHRVGDEWTMELKSGKGKVQ